MDDEQPIGLIGLGLMGMALTRRWVGQGSRVVGFDIDVGRGELFQQAGGQLCGSNGDVVERCEVCVLSLPHSGIAAVVIDQLLPSLRAGKVVVDTTTGSPDEMRSFAERLAGQGVAYLDATVSGSSYLLEQGEVTVMVGGDIAALDRVRFIFAAFAKHVIHVGASGNGARMKLVANLVLGLNRAALAEGLAFGEAIGLDTSAVLNVLLNSPAHSRIMESKGDLMVNHSYEPPQARLAQHRKDVGLILSLAEQHAIELPLSEAHRDLLDLSIQLGLGELDNAAIFEACRRVE